MVDFIVRRERLPIRAINLEKDSRRNPEALTQSPDMFFRQLSLAIEYIGGDAFGPEYIKQIFLAQFVRLHEVSYDFNWFSVLDRICLRFEVLNQHREQLDQLALGGADGFLTGKPLQLLEEVLILLLATNHLWLRFAEQRRVIQTSNAHFFQAPL